MKNILLIVFSAVVYTVEGQTYFLNGNAIAIGDDCYQLTGSATLQNGTVWYADQIDLTQPFDLQFLMNFGNLDGNGADGMCFVLQTVGTNAIGTVGGGLGYLNFGTSLGIEFDTWQNGEYGDLTADHIAIEMNGDINHNSASNIAGPIQADAFDQNIEDGEEHLVRITWNPTDQFIQVYFDCEFRLSGEIDMINEIFNGQSLVYWGFTAATGGSFNNQIVCLQESILNQTESLTICTGASTMLVAGASSDGLYTWTPETFLDDPTSGSPTASPPSSMTYTVEFNDLCGTPTQLNFEIEVTDLEVTISGIETLNCINDNTTIVAELNLDLDAAYSWSLDGINFSNGENLQNMNTMQAGNYTLEVNVQDACFAEVNFEIPADYSEYNVDAGADQSIDCNNSSAQLVATYNGNGADVQWTLVNENILGATSLEYTATQAGSYTVQITHPISGCVSEDEVIVTEDFTTPEVNIGDQDSLTCIHPVLEIQNVNISSANSYGVNWTTVNGTLAGGANTPGAFVSAPGTYVITVQDENTGCTSQASVFVGIASSYTINLSSMTFPNVITANGDSKNDRWLPFLKNDPLSDISSLFSEFNLQIFNRWGILIFETQSYNSAFTGVDVEEGVYYYILHYKTACDNAKSDDIEGYLHILK